MEVIPSVIPPGMRDQLPIIFDSMRQVFVLSMHETFYVGALVCFVALGFSFLMQNPARRTAVRGPRAGSLHAPRRPTDRLLRQENGPPVEIRLEGKNALVTGASSGIGQGIAVALAAAGADVGINYRSNANGAEETSRRVREPGHRALIRSGRRRSRAGLDDVRRFDAEMGPIDILVANAGHGSTPEPLHETSWEEWDRVLRSNLHGAFLCGREAARAWSTPARAGASSTSPRFTKKPATCRMTVLLRGQGRRPSHPFHGTRARSSRHPVNDVAPGMILTPMNRRALEDADYRADAGAQIPLRRPGTPEDIAAMVVFLCSEHASYCTGGTYLVDGGWMLSWPPV